MPRKAAASVGEESSAPRRSTRIKEQPSKSDAAPKRAPAKPRAKKEAADKEEKPKSTRGTKRKAEDEPNGAGEDAEASAAKKVCFWWVAMLQTLRHMIVILGKTCFEGKAVL